MRRGHRVSCRSVATGPAEDDLRDHFRAQRADVVCKEVRERNQSAGRDRPTWSRDRLSSGSRHMGATREAQPPNSTYLVIACARPNGKYVEVRIGREPTL
jgi:hypothetical protein